MTPDASNATLIFGGTFDPPHRAHTELPPLVAERAGCARILYVPTSMNPLKQEQPTPARHRLAMLELAVAGIANASICRDEIDSAEPCYTVDLLEALHAREPGTTWRLMLGADAALSFNRWRRPQRILDLATPAIALRPPWDGARWHEALGENFPPQDAARWASWTVDVPVVDVCSSDVRRRLATGDDVDDLLLPAVLDYIRRQDLYRAASCTAGER